MTPKDPNSFSESQGLPRDRILRGRKKFDKLFTGGRVIHGEKVMLRYYPDDEILTYYMAFIVAKRLGKAVYRNKVKRRMREAFRRNLFLLDSLYSSDGSNIPGFYGAFMAKSIDLEYAQAKDDIVKLIEKLIKRMQVNFNTTST